MFPHLKDYINEFIIQKLNLLVFVDFRFISAFLYVHWALNSHMRQLLNFYLLRFPEFDVNVLEAILTFKDFQSDQVQGSSRQIFTAHYACRNAHLQAIWYYAMVRFRTIDLKSHPITQFEENCIIHKKMLNSSKVNNEF